MLVRHLKSIVGVAVLIAFVVVWGSCASPYAASAPMPNAPHFKEALVVEVEADWDDLSAALLVAASAAEVGLVETKPARVDAGREFLEWEYLTIRDDSMRVLASREVRGGAVGPERIRLSAMVGETGDRPAELRLLEAWKKRLGQLKGREWAPR